MQQARWYDKNSDLQDVVEVIRRVDRPIQNNIAQDILQILMTDFNLNLDDKINAISKNYNCKCNRWHDQNIDLFTSFEIIKGFSPELQTSLAQKVKTSMLLTCLSESM